VGVVRRCLCLHFLGSRVRVRLELVWWISRLQFTDGVRKWSFEGCIKGYGTSCGVGRAVLGAGSSAATAAAEGRLPADFANVVVV